MILHITSSVEWEKAVALGEYIAPSLGTEGFIHCSTPAQTADTANLFFRGHGGLVLLCVDDWQLRYFQDRNRHVQISDQPFAGDNDRDSVALSVG